MIYKEVVLHEIFENLPEGNNAVLDCYSYNKVDYLEGSKVRPAILIIPGGGYANVAPRESEPVAFNFLSQGFNVFVLKYSVVDKVFPQQLHEVSAAMAYIRRNSEELLVDKDRIAVCGFSAGGHVLGCLSTLWQDEISYKKLGLEYGENKPNKAIFCYPVITSGEYTHKSSFKYLLGEDKFNEEKLNLLSIEKNVTKDMPTSFIWHTYEDKSVPVQNSLFLMAALADKEIPFEAHIYEKGIHGLSLSKNLTSIKEEQIEKQAASWFKLAVNWLDWHNDLINK